MFAPGYKGKRGGDDIDGASLIGRTSTPPAGMTFNGTEWVKASGGQAPPAAPPTGQPNGQPNAQGSIFAALMGKLSPETTVALNNLNTNQMPGNPAMGTGQMAPLPPTQFRFPMGRLFGGSLFGRMK